MPRSFYIDGQEFKYIDSKWKNVIAALANQILKQELREKWKEKTYEDIRNSNNYTFTSDYLTLSANFDEFSSSAKVSTMMKLAEFDLQRGIKEGVPHLSTFN